MQESRLVHNDDEGRCIITDHGRIILVHLYGPAVVDLEAERFPRKLVFYKVQTHSLHSGAFLVPVVTGLQNTITCESSL